MARAKKLSKTIEGSIITIVEAETGESLVFDVSELPENVQENLKMHGASQKLGDAAAGRAGQDAIDSINSVWASMAEGKWSTRVPAAPKVTKKSILEKFEGIEDPEEKAIAEKLLKDLGLI